MNNCVWKAKSDYIKSFPQTSYTDEQLVDAFIDVNKHWFVDEINEMFGWQDRVREELLRCLDGKEPTKNIQLIYAEMKFSTEWIGPNGIFSKE